MTAYIFHIAVGGFEFELPSTYQGSQQSVTQFDESIDRVGEHIARRLQGVYLYCERMEPLSGAAAT